MKWYQRIIRWWVVHTCEHDWVAKSAIPNYKDDDNTLFICTKCAEEV